MHAEINRVLLDRHIQELQLVVVDCIRRRLNQLNAIAGVGSHVLMNQAIKSEVGNYIAIHRGRLTIQSHPIFLSKCPEGVYKTSIQCTFRYSELSILGFFDTFFLSKFAIGHRNEPIELREDRNHGDLNTARKNLANKYAKKKISPLTFSAPVFAEEISVGI